MPRVKDDDVQVEMRVLREEDKRSRNLAKAKNSRKKEQMENLEVEGRLPGWNVPKEKRQKSGTTRYLHLEESLISSALKQPSSRHCRDNLIQKKDKLT